MVLIVIIHVEQRSDCWSVTFLLDQRLDSVEIRRIQRAATSMQLHVPTQQ